MAAAILRSEERYRWAGHAFSALATYIVSLAFPIPVLGILAFGQALETLVHCIISPTCAFAGDWLLGLSWLANPAAWAGMVFLLVGRARRAALSGELALLLGACALRPGMFCQYVWLASMVYVVFVALCVPGDVSAADKGMLSKLSLPRVRPIFYPAVALPLVFGVLLLLLGQRGYIHDTPFLPESDRNDCVHTGEDAKLRILDSAQCAARPGADKPVLPASASNFWVYEDGSFSGSRTYWTFNCGSDEECLKAVESLGGLRRSDLSPWQPSRYAVIMHGPAFYSTNAAPSKKLRANPWDVRGITNGLFYQKVIRDDGLLYYAIDFDRSRVYHLREFGGFSDDEYQPTGK